VWRIQEPCFHLIIATTVEAPCPSRTLDYTEVQVKMTELRLEISEKALGPTNVTMAKLETNESVSSFFEVVI
jgi:hypothetical protein